MESKRFKPSILSLALKKLFSFYLSQPAVLRRPYGIPGTKPSFTMCKANALPMTYFTMSPNPPNKGTLKEISFKKKVRNQFYTTGSNAKRKSKCLVQS